MPGDALERLARWLAGEPISTRPSRNIERIALHLQGGYIVDLFYHNTGSLQQRTYRCGTGPTLADAINAALDAAGAEP